METAIREAITAVLNEEDGVSFETYEKLLTLGEFLADFGTPIFDRVEATDGRFYLPSEDQ